MLALPKIIGEFVAVQKIAPSKTQREQYCQASHMIFPISKAIKWHPGKISKKPSKNEA
jgi:hypothetical protein